MNIVLNGTSTTVAATSVAELVRAETGSDSAEGIAVAVNGAVVPASQWERALAPGDSVDILTAVQGG